MENLSPRLKELFSEITTAVDAVEETVRRNPRELSALARIIERGEKRIAREHAKRLDEIKNLQNEIEAITEFAAKMGYTLTDTEPDETEETQPDAATTEKENAATTQPETQPTGGIKIVIEESATNDNK